MAVGAYASYDIWLHAPWLNLIVVFVLGGVCAAAAGVLFGLPSLRIKGYYLAVATLAAQFFFDWMFIRIPWFTGYAPSGSVSAPPLRILGLKFDSPAGRYLLCLTLLCLLALAAKNIVRGETQTVHIEMHAEDRGRSVVAACRRRDSARAESLAGGLEGDVKKRAAAVCAGEGIDLP